jgi:non-ribosomal peptide synthetase component E (peptide arylation enzyme)
VDAEVLIAAEDGAAVATGEIGEIRVRAPFTMAGYHNARSATRRRWPPAAGSAPVAFRPGLSAPADELRDFARARLAGHKIPKRVVVVDAIPRSPVGKILRRALRDPLWTDQEGRS